MSIEIQNLTTSVFDNINLSILENGLYGIIGRNGAGKSTLFTAINGEMKLKSGQISTGSVVYIPNLDIFDKNLSATDYIKLLTGEAQNRAKQLMPLFQASRFFDKKIRTYSLGMQEILAFIYTMSLPSDVIIVDELMNGLDNTMRELAFRILKDEAQHKIILLTSHILEEVEKYCDKVYFLARDGFSEVEDFAEAKKLIEENEVFV